MEDFYNFMQTMFHHPPVFCTKLKTILLLECKPNLLCPWTKQVVCGTDGKDYRNMCYLLQERCRSGDTVTLAYHGPCDTGRSCRQYCPLTYQPVCGSDGQTYSNKCMLDVNNCLYKTNNVLVHYGKCKNKGGSLCDRCDYNDKKTICGTDGITYYGTCSFQKAQCHNRKLKQRHAGDCRKCDKACNYEYKHVCGSDGRTYSNECLLSIVTCNNPGIKLKHIGACGTCPDTCSKKKSLVCGSDGKTYQNECELKKEKCFVNKDLRIKFRGSCFQKFSVEGQLVLPKYGYFKALTKNSCVRLLVQDAIQCNDCQIPQRGSLLMRNIQIKDGKVYFKVDGKGGEGDYYVTAHINVGWCGSGANKGVRKGDLKNKFLVQFQLPRGSSTKKNLKIEMDYVGYNECGPPCYADIGICGSDGRDYQSECHMMKQSCHKKRRIYTKHVGRCECGPKCRNIDRPVCGSDQKTYQSDCHLRRSSCQERLSVTKNYNGKCKKCGSPCRNGDSSVCGSNQKTYQSECHLKRESCLTKTHIRKQYNGQCHKCGPPCRNGGVSVCGSNQKTYHSECHLKRESCLTKTHIRKKYNGQCRNCKSACTFEYDPRCASNGRTYDNNCLLSIAHCHDSNVKFKHWGRCGTCSEKCPRNIDYVCGSDGKTYVNECELNKQRCYHDRNLRKQSPGRCVVEMEFIVKGQLALPYQFRGNLPEGSCMKVFVTKKVCGSTTSCLASVKGVLTTKQPNIRFNRIDYQLTFNGQPGMYYLNVRLYRGWCPSSRSYQLRDGDLYNQDKEIVYFHHNDKTKKAPVIKMTYFGNPDQSQCVKHCRLVEDFVCGTDKVTYTNPCLLAIKTCTSNGMVKKAHNGKCGKKPKGDCERTSYPYSCLRRGFYWYFDYYLNRCMRRYGCPGSANNFVNEETCQATCAKNKCDIQCNDSLNYPVCGTNNLTYSNRCQLKKAECEMNGRVKLAHNGKCNGHQINRHG
uniref:Agrin-like n=1 Tax=Clytia hemisphaerica TaxID=252671 RepID=A0A7M5X3C1_9CNID